MTTATAASVKVVSHRLFLCLFWLIALLLILVVILMKTEQVVTLPIVLGFGALGAFISLQRRLKELSEEDLSVFNASFSYTLLAPVGGAVLAGILYLLFASELLAGKLFPHFIYNSKAVEDANGIAKLFQIEAEHPSDYAKLLFWCFVAGFSEHFVTDIIGKLSIQADSKGSRNKEGTKDVEASKTALGVSEHKKD